MDIKKLYEETELTQQQIANKLGIPRDRVIKFINKNYSSEYRKTRKSICYRNSKLGDKNPMLGKFLEDHPRYKEVVSDNKGYWMVVKPDWYTGRKGSHHIFEHSKVVCENLKITEVPKGWCVHHCDEQPRNNSFDNLVMLTMGDHMRLHSYLRGATTISKESTLKWVETYGTPWSHDIVSSSWEHEAAKAVQEVTNPVEDK